MRKVSTEDIEKIKELYKTGKSLNYLATFLNLPKTTVYYYTRKFFGKKIKQIKFDRESKEELGEILGVFVGDGNFTFDKKNYGYVVQFILGFDEVKYAKRLSDLIRKVFGKTCYFIVRQKQNSIVVRIKSKTIYEILRRYLIWKNGKKTYTIHFKREILKDKKLLVGILRGLLNTDGSVYPPKRKLTYSSVSKRLIKQVSLIYSRILGTEVKIYKIRPKEKKKHTLYTIDIYGKEKIAKIYNFLGELGNEKKDRRIKQILEAPVI